MSVFVEKMLNDAANNPEQTIKNVGAIADLITKLTPSDQLARSHLIESIKAREDISDLDKAVMISESKKILKEYKNKSDVVQKAIEILGPQAEKKFDAVDDEWSSRFLDSVKHVSKDDLQTIWARILANECQTPGSVPKALLNTLSFLDTENAKCFSALCDFTVETLSANQVFPIIDTNQSDLLSKYNIGHSTLAELQSFGLIQYSGISSYRVTAPKIVFTYGNTTLRYKWINEATPPHEDIHIGYVLFTKTGKSLYKAISRNYLSEFLDYFSRYATGVETCIEIIDIVTTTHN